MVVVDALALTASDIKFASPAETILEKLPRWFADYKRVPEMPPAVAEVLSEQTRIEATTEN